MTGIECDGDEDGAVDPRSSGLIHDLVARVALELATTPEGRAAGLSVEVWPEHGGIVLRARDGHELHVLIEQSKDGVQARWEHVTPSSASDRSDASRASLGEPRPMVDSDLRALMASWLALRARG